MKNFEPQTITERIQQRRIQMLAHSYLYYELDDPIISDDQWQRWADELTQLQAAHPNACGFYSHAFADWDGSTGMHLPRDEWVRQDALMLRAIHARYQSNPQAAKASPAPALRPPALFDAPKRKAAPDVSVQGSLF